MMLVVAILLAGAMASAQTGSGYQLAKRVPLGGKGFWDYFAVDPVSGRVFIPRGDRVIILDADGKRLADVMGFSEAHAIAFAPELKLAYVSDGGQATVLSTETNKVVRKMDLKDNEPDAILFDPSTQRVFAFGEKGATVFDGKTGTRLATIVLGGKPEFAQADGAGFVYVNIEDKNELARLDAKQLKVLNKWPITGCQRPSGLAIDVEHQRLFAGCGGSNTMVAIRYTDGKVLGSAPIAKGTDATAYDPGTQLAFASCGQGIVTVVHEDSPGVYKAVQQIKTEPGARTMALDRKSHNVYTVTAKMGPPPAPTAENPHPYPSIVPETFAMLIYKR
jgi:DNA-binding beta-propeller fold protein YncE